MLRDDELPPLPPSEKVMTKLTALQYIEVERYATDQLREYGRAVEQAAYAAAIKACAVTRGKNHAEAAAFKSGTKAYVQACDDCEDAIRSLMEQPK